MGYNSEVQYIPDKYVGRVIEYDNKESLVTFIYRSTLNKTQSMFEWKNLPDTIQQRDMERLIQTNGYGVFLKVGGQFYCLYGTLGGMFNFNYMPTRAIVHNPYVKELSEADKNYFRIFYGYSQELEFPKQNIEPTGDCVVIVNDAMYMGLDPLINNYANRLADTYISRRMATINARAAYAFVAKDADTAKSIGEFMKGLEKGKLAAIYDKRNMPFGDQNGAYSLPYADGGSSGRSITELIEAEQYDKASLLNELGLNSNYNMKREAINSDESQLNFDALLPMADQMLDQRKLACKRIEKIFGLKLEVDFASSWKQMREALSNSEETNQLVQEDKGGENENDSDDNVSGDDGGVDSDGDSSGQ